MEVVSADTGVEDAVIFKSKCESWLRIKSSFSSTTECDVVVVSLVYSVDDGASRNSVLARFSDRFSTQLSTQESSSGRLRLPSSDTAGGDFDFDLFSCLSRADLDAPANDNVVCPLTSFGLL